MLSRCVELLQEPNPFNSTDWYTHKVFDNLNSNRSPIRCISIAEDLTNKTGRYRRLSRRDLNEVFYSAFNSSMIQDLTNGQKRLARTRWWCIQRPDMARMLNVVCSICGPRGKKQLIIGRSSPLIYPQSRRIDSQVGDRGSDQPTHLRSAGH